MLQPKRTKYRKNHTLRLNNEKVGRQTRIARTSGGVQPNKPKTSGGRFKIVALSITRLKASTIEAVRRVLTRKLKRTGQVSVNIHASLSVTQKPLESRMGKGKGLVSYWVCSIKKGQVLYEIDGVDFLKAKSAWLLATNRLPIKTKFLVCVLSQSQS